MGNLNHGVDPFGVICLELIINEIGVRFIINITMHTPPRYDLIFVEKGIKLKIE